jgi:hypothetical protein
MTTSLNLLDLINSAYANRQIVEVFYFIDIGFIGLNKKEESGTSSRRSKQKPTAKKAKFIPDPDKEGVMVSKPYRGAPKVVKNAVRILKNSFGRGSLLLRNVRAQYSSPSRPKRLVEVLEELHLNNMDNVPSKTVLLTCRGSFHFASQKRLTKRKAGYSLADRSFLMRNFNSARVIRRKTLKEVVLALKNN